VGEDGGETAASCLYIGDVGDNLRVRPYITVYAVKEPFEYQAAHLVGTWHGIYPGGPEDSETLLVHPRSGRIYVVTKAEAETSEIYRFAKQAGDEAEILEHVASIALPDDGSSRLTTGGDWDPDGDRVAIRTYSGVWEWEADPCLPDEHWGAAPVFLGTSEGQGEAVAYDLEGNIVTTSEGSPMAVSQLACLDVGPAGAPCDTGGPELAVPATEGGCAGCGEGDSGLAWLLLPLGTGRLRSRRLRCRDRSRRRSGPC